ncbi:MAG TPA: Asp-tRNA(Asn)/Glu-tRNA(Gln) amidotransferase GatCAB subunit C, partial [Myxococcales bacterium]|nr:Asp-tRNA(Asn)/Glu-tRNA(Gln) amidotransferase GatCAB subunit C [Myxococcales bacterium]
MSEIKIDAQAVQNAARLARIAICEQEAIELAKELDEVRVWIDQLQQV